jgi:hypothetical protein
MRRLQNLPRNARARRMKPWAGALVNPCMGGSPGALGRRGGGLRRRF